ncbi:diguanylate cyclase [Acidicapsa dinghuensis]|uniref:diguanylate cyclase n=1 Tax=Acidicapsa dinghuensis TaxID=2218256 RepID=A0ABW1EA54_9BACT|nr:diguanylate cyclase [Acidicapsa dinghuensis]
MAFPRARVVLPLIQFAVTGVVMWALMVWLGGRQHLLYVWPIGAIQIAFLLPWWSDPVSRYRQVAAAAAGQLSSLLLLSVPIWIALSFSVAGAAELFVMGYLLSPGIQSFDRLKHRSQVLRFATAAVVVPAIALIPVAFPVAAFTHVTVRIAWLTVMPSDALGYAVVFPALFFLLTGEYRSPSKLLPHLLRAAPSILLFVAASIAIFFQDTNPFLFLIFPPLILLIFALGLEGAVFALPIVTVVACLATAQGRGPIWLKSGTDIHHSTLVLQIFLCAVSAVALAVGALLDERRRVGRAAEEAQSIYRTLIANAEDMIILSTLDGRRRYVSPAVRKLTGFTEEEFLALRHLETVHPADRDLARTVIASLAAGKLDHTFRYRIPCKDGSWRWVEGFVRGFYEPNSQTVSGYVATVRDISSLKETEENWMAERAVLAQENQHLAHIANRDELTGIANRRAFKLVLQHETARQTRSEKPIALLMIDVDWFKKYNDRYGHPAGDECLQLIAQAIASTAGRASDHVARLGGEEFAALLPGTDANGARLVARNMIDAIAGLNIEHEDSPFRRVTVSIGISLWPLRYTSETAYLIQQADRALYECKSRGRNTIVLWEEELAVSSAEEDTYWEI